MRRNPRSIRCVSAAALCAVAVSLGAAGAGLEAAPLRDAAAVAGNRHGGPPSDRGSEGVRGAGSHLPLAAGRQASGTGGALPRVSPFRPGTVFRDCPECPEMIVVPGGSFIMGDRPAGKIFGLDEVPRHRVEFSRPFAAGRYEVTFAEWDACVAAGGCGGHRPADEGWGRGNRPVINVSWTDARSYAAWLSGRTGKAYRLLSEAEWEYAARAGSSTTYSWGDRPGRNRANCRDCGSRWDDRRTAPAGSFAANAFGLHDMHGNVWEWVADCRRKNYEGAPADGRVRENGDCGRRMARGGSWRVPRELLRVAFRDAGDFAMRDLSVGFRVARTLAP